ncbi:MAG: mannose-6-phosphate isomerase, class I [Acidimicrobiales bacterium]|nr:mannose-6-phosphate isomerase, class I [Acidimicrobiales bacterium]
MYPLSGVVQPYAWGSPTFLASLQGREPTGDPEAELWLGDHPLAPALVHTPVGVRPLPEVIAADPAAALGAADRSALPYLLKILAAAAPLSLQAHPSAAQAAAGFAREEAAGIPRTAAHRTFRDPNPKPELVCALTPFDALCGFRPVGETLELLASLHVAALAPVVGSLRARGADALPGVVGSLLGADASAAADLVADVVAACERPDGPYPAERAWAVRLAAAYPGDPGVVLALLLNLVTLAPGEALFLGPGNLHAYLEGAAVEIMANSDNVLRGGLTPKHVDVPALVGILDTSVGRPDVQRPAGPLHVYHCPVPEFSLVRAVLGGADGPVGFAPAGPEILLVTAGMVVATLRDGAALELRAGEAAFVPAGDGPYTVGGSGTVFRATTGSGADR